jgi:UrcA family protein
MRNTALFALALIASAATVAPTAVTAAEAETVTSIVRTADLDLSSGEGRHALDLRIARAAREVCGTASPVDLEGEKSIRHCREQTVARVTAQREELLTAAKSGSPIIVASAR